MNTAPFDLRRASLIARWFGPRTTVGVKARLIAASVAIVCAAVLTIAALLTPDPRGYGTHQQLGTKAFAPCGTLIVTGLPCPTCGMTTAYAHLMHGHPLAALLAQPAGALLCVATIVALALSLYIAASGRAPTVRWERLAPVPVAIALAIFFLGGWAFKIVHGLVAGTLPIR